MKYEITAKRLMDALERKDMKAQELSMLAGVHKSSISQYVNGSHIPSNISAGKIGKVLDVNPVWLMGYDVPMITPKKQKGESGTAAERESLYIEEADSVICSLNEENIKKAIKYMNNLLALQKAEEELR